MRAERKRLAIVSAVTSALLSASVPSASVVSGSVLPASAVATAPYCGLTWGSVPKQAVQPARGPRTVVDVRAGRHACFDRLVIDVDGRAYDYWVQYVEHVRVDASGEIVPLKGGANLHVGVGAGAQASSTYPPANGTRLVDVAGYRTFRQVAFAGSVEGRTTIGLGVRARLPFRVFVLEGPGSGSRIVVDVAHHWRQS